MKITNIFYLLAILMLVSCGASEKNINSADVETLYVGTYTQKESHVHGKADGIFVLNMDKNTGELKVRSTIIDIVNPSYLVIHPNKKYMYAVQEASAGGNYGRVLSYNIEGAQAQKINSVSANGHAPCHISIDPSGKFVLVANYVETIASYKIMEDGGLTRALSVHKHERTQPEEVRQETGHPHMIIPALDKIFVSDLGLDSIFHYELSDTGTLHLVTRTATQFKSGPRHIDFHPNNKWCYALNELNRTVEVFHINSSSEPFERVQVANTLATDDEKVYAGAIHLHPSGKFLYTSNRGVEDSPSQSISIFSVNQENGQTDFD